jgi:hypothetical protein
LLTSVPDPQHCQRLRNAPDYVPRKVDDDCRQELRWVHDRRDLAELRRDIAQWLSRWQGKYSRLCNWVEEHVEETLTYFCLPLPHHKHMKSPERAAMQAQHGRPRGKESGSRMQARPRSLQRGSSLVAPVRRFGLPRRCHWLTKRS